MVILFYIVSTVIFVLPLILSVHLLIEILMYIRFKIRNNTMKLLAEEFNLTFHPSLPPFFLFFFQSFFKNFQLNLVEGSIYGHHVVINDTYFSSIYNFFLQHRRQTSIEIDGQSVHGDMKSFSFGSRFYLTTIPELKKYFAELKNGVGKKVGDTHALESTPQ